LTFAVILVAVLFGALIGSFLNVVIWRVPRGESIVTPASHCPNCDHPIRRRDNVPVLSWILLRGKCRDCSAPISPRYPLIEAATALAFGGVATWASLSPAIGARDSGAATVGFLLALVAYLYFAAISIALSMIDIDTKRLPNVIVLPAYLVGAVLLAASSLLEGNLQPLLFAGIGAFALFGLYLLLAVIVPRGMGFGDVKLAGVIGLFTGFLGVGPLIVSAFAAFFVGGLFSVVMLLLRRAGRKSRIPFGPWMLAGAWIGIVGGEELWGGYLRLWGLT
jgi:leader peptidase (prepilin peptidase) / N-methyltransferase